MKIERQKQPRMTINEFADRHDLTMVVVERPIRHRDGLKDLYCHFKSAEVKDGGLLRGASGNGNSEDEAISDYARQISEQLLVIDAMTQERREIFVPVLVEDDEP